MADCSFNRTGGLRTSLKKIPFPWNFQPHKRPPAQEFPVFLSKYPWKIYFEVKCSWKINSFAPPPRNFQLPDTPPPVKLPEYNTPSPGKFSIGPQPPRNGLKMQSANGACVESCHKCFECFTKATQDV